MVYSQGNTNPKRIRLMNFGKYKNLPILRVICEHPSYIAWCLDNVKDFALNKDEQDYYDWEIIACKKYSIPFNNETLKHVKDKKALDNLETPFWNDGIDILIPNNLEIYSLLKEADCFEEEPKRERPKGYLIKDRETFNNGYVYERDSYSYY